MIVNEPKFILVVEDDEELCKAMQNSLLSAGYKTMSAHSLRDGIKKIRNQAFFCIILDFPTDDGSAEDIIENIRKNTGNLNIETPIIVISSDLDRDLVKSLAGKVQGALVKPFEANVLVEAVRRLEKTK